MEHITDPSWWEKEPALITGLVTSVIVLAVAFGAPIGEDQKTAILGVVAALLSFLGSLVIRENVYSPASVEKLTGEDHPEVPGV